MSGPPPGPGMGSRQNSMSAGPPSAGGSQLPPPHHQSQQPPMGVAPGPPPPQGAPPGQQPASQQNLNQIVLEYLGKKGYNRTEAMLRKESAQPTDRPVITRAEESGGYMYQRAFYLTQQWIEENLDIYKAELRRILWPLFVHFFLDCICDYYIKDAEHFFKTFSEKFAREHEEDLRALGNIRSPENVQDNEIAQLYRKNKYRVSLTQMAFYNLIQHLESKEAEGGTVAIRVLQHRMQVQLVKHRTAANDKSFEAIAARAKLGDEDMPAEDEGIPGHNPGSANTDPRAPDVLAKLNLGSLPQDPDLMDDVRAQLEEEDAKNPPAPGQPSLLDEYEQKIKREPNDENLPNRDMIPLPPPLARDVAMEVQKVKENRDRFKLDGRTGGVGPGVSVTMYTFHNTFDSINCLDFSGDLLLVAAGMSESYIRIWSMDGTALKSALPSSDSKPSASQRLIGHSGPVYAVSFSPSIENPSTSPDAPSTASRYLLSSSADKTIRLWSLDTWTCLVVYRGHESPVWDVRWSPYGDYFLSAGHDRTARLWRTDIINALKYYVGHDSDVDCATFHPNGTYVFTGSSDRTVRMWNASNGVAVRMFTGHTGNVTSLACSPDGKTLASADDQGAILMWDLEKGKRKKRMRGHGKGGIWSLSWSVESNVLVSGGADGTVRVWDVLLDTDPSSTGKVVAEGGAGVKIDGASSGTPTAAAASATGAVKAIGASTGIGGVGGVGGAGKGKGKDALVTVDQISAFPTKKSPVYKVQFTSMNLVVAGGAYLP